jgi:hypothetical protein
VTVLAMLPALALGAQPAPVVCDDASCLVASTSAFPSLVVGELVRVDDPAAARRWWLQARSQGAWTTLPGDGREFAELVRPVAIRTVERQDGQERPRELTVLMTQFEYETGPLPAGTLVRYAPHGVDHERAPEDQPRLAPWWDVTGCVLALCAPRDDTCKAAYLPGIYERTTGRAADWRSGLPTSAAPLIEPISRRPVRRASATAGGGP